MEGRKRKATTEASDTTTTSPKEHKTENTPAPTYSNLVRHIAAACGIAPENIATTDIDIKILTDGLVSLGTPLAEAQKTAKTIMANAVAHGIVKNLFTHPSFKAEDAAKMAHPLKHSGGFDADGNADLAVLDQVDHYALRSSSKKLTKPYLTEEAMSQFMQMRAATNKAAQKPSLCPHLIEQKLADIGSAGEIRTSFEHLSTRQDNGKPVLTVPQFKKIYTDPEIPFFKARKRHSARVQAMEEQQRRVAEAVTSGALPNPTKRR